MGAMGNRPRSGPRARPYPGEMKVPFTTSLATVLLALAGPGTSTAGIGASEEDVLARLLRRPAGSSWITGDTPSTWWLGDGDRALPLGLIGQVRSTSPTDRLDLTRTTVGIATTGGFMGRPDDVLGLTATVATGPESFRVPSSMVEEEEISFGVHHGWRLGTDVQLRSSIGWRTGPELREPVVWGGFGLQFEF